MTKTLITMGTLLAAIGLTSVSAADPKAEEIPWPAADSLKLGWVPMVPVTWQPSEELSFVTADEKFDLAKHMELPVGSVVILPPWMLAQQSSEDPRR